MCLMHFLLSGLKSGCLLEVFVLNGIQVKGVQYRGFTKRFLKVLDFDNVS